LASAASRRLARPTVRVEPSRRTSPTLPCTRKNPSAQMSLATVRWSIAYQRSFGLDTERSSAFFNLIGDEQNCGIKPPQKRTPGNLASAGSTGGNKLCTFHRGAVMQVPSIPCRKALTDGGSHFVARGSVVAGVCTSALVWALSIPKTIDLCGLR
jgi:hypothetical protein